MRYGKYNDTDQSPATEMFLITPSASPLPKTLKALRAGSAGSVTFKLEGSPNSVTLDLAAREIFPAKVTHVTATTISPLHGLA